MGKNEQAAELRDGLERIDLSSAQFLEIERGIYQALSSSRQSRPFSIPRVAPLSEAVDLDDLVGDHLRAAHDAIGVQVGRLDTLYGQLSDTGNETKSKLDTADSYVSRATAAFQDVAANLNADEALLWAADSFNTPTFVDFKLTTAQVDVDYGRVTLSPISVEEARSFDVVLDRSGTKGIPGCNMLVLDTPFAGTAEKEPTVLTEGLNTAAIGNMFDGDPSTWFEIERNFVAPKQKTAFNGRAYNRSESGTETDVKAATLDMDWLVYVQWGEDPPDTNGDGIRIAEFVDLGGELDSPQRQQNYEVSLAFELVLKEPTELSLVKIAPFVRERTSQKARVRSIQVFASGQWLEIARDVELGTGKAVSRLQRELLKRTGNQDVGAVYSIPTDRPVEKIRFLLYSLPEEAARGLAHAFRDFLHFHRSERNHGLWRTSDEWREWARDPVNKTPPTIVSQFNPDRLSGTSTVPGVQGSVQVGQSSQRGRTGNGLSASTLFQGYDLYTQLSGAAKQTAGAKTPQDFGNSAGDLNVPGIAGPVRGLQTIGSGLQLARLGGTWLGKAVPYIGAAMTLADLAAQLFTFNHEEKIEDGHAGFDVFKGWRAAIAIRDLSLLKVKYAPSSTLFTVKRTFSKPVNAIGLFVEEDVPDSWGPGNWLSYYISIDGVEWSPLPKLADTSIDRAYKPPRPVTEVLLRVDIQGNAADDYHTPTLLNYAVWGNPA